MKILIAGAGVIGSIYATMLSRAGHDITIFARSGRLSELMENGLIFCNPETNKTEKADVRITSRINAEDAYDFIFVAVRYDQVEAALSDIKANCSSNIVTMVNNPLGYDLWEKIAGKGRIIPAFPGAGGKIENAVLHYRITPGFIQSTTFGELSGGRTPRIIHLYNLLKSSGFSAIICDNMEEWQKSHLAMVIPLANAIYSDGGNNFTTARNRKIIHNLSLSLNENFNFLKNSGIRVTPSKLNIFRLCPAWILDFILSRLYETEFAETLISSHAKKARQEMDMLKIDFISLAESKGTVLQYMKS